MSAQAQEASRILDTFKRNFAIASLDVKIQILQDAAGGKNAADMGPLYEQALEFVTDNGCLVASDPRFNQLAAIAAEQVGTVKYVPAKDSLWKLFQINADSQTLQKAADALGVVGAAMPISSPTSTTTWTPRTTFLPPARRPIWSWWRPASRRWESWGTRLPSPSFSRR